MLSSMIFMLIIILFLMNKIIQNIKDRPERFNSYFWCNI